MRFLLVLEVSAFDKWQKGVPWEPHVWRGKYQSRTLRRPGVGAKTRNVLEISKKGRKRTSGDFVGGSFSHSCAARHAIPCCHLVVTSRFLTLFCVGPSLSIEGFVSKQVALNRGFIRSCPESLKRQLSTWANPAPGQ